MPDLGPGPGLFLTLSAVLGALGDHVEADNVRGWASCPVPDCSSIFPSAHWSLSAIADETEIKPIDGSEEELSEDEENEDDEPHGLRAQYEIEK